MEDDWLKWSSFYFDHLAGNNLKLIILMKTEIEKLTSLLRKTFNANAWHGPAVKEVLHDVTPELSLKRLNNTHSIIELVTHMTSWRIFVIEKLQGNEQYTVSDELNFPKTTDWVRAVADLDASQSRLLAAIEKFPLEKLSELVPPSDKYKYTYYTLIHGIINHDLYHTGQIMLIKKAHSV
jgi:uncharacterized damage-inducible protein DinB